MKTIKINEQQLRHLVNEDYPFNYTGNESTATNTNSEVTAEGPDINSPDIKVTPMTSDKLGQIRYNDFYHRFNGRGMASNALERITPDETDILDVEYDDEI